MGRREGKRPSRIWKDNTKTDLQYYNRGRDSADGLGGPGIESRWGRDFSPVQTGPVAHPTSYTMDTWPFPGVKRPGRGADNPLPPSAKDEERVKLYICSPSGSSWPILG